MQIDQKFCESCRFRGVSKNSSTISSVMRSGINIVLQSKTSKTFSKSFSQKTRSTLDKAKQQTNPWHHTGAYPSPLAIALFNNWQKSIKLFFSWQRLLTARQTMPSQWTCSSETPTKNPFKLGFVKCKQPSWNKNLRQTSTQPLILYIQKWSFLFTGRS